MLPKTYQETFRIRSASCDLRDTWRPSAILETMQDAAVSHCISLEIGRKEMVPMGLAWVITRCEVDMQRMPRVNEKITVTTVPMPPRRLFFPRHYLFHDEGGNLIGMANTLWVLLDLNTRHIARPNEYITAHLPDNSDMTCPMGMPGTAAAPGEDAIEAQLLPKYTDLDANMHVNNARYLDWCCNAIGIETLSKHALTHFTVNYTAEIRPGTEIRTVLGLKEQEFAFCGYNQDGTCHFSISGTLSPVEAM